MSTAEEDRIREKYKRRKPGDSRYSWFNPGHVYMMQERERRVLELLKKSGIESLAEQRILEIGCGQGAWLRDLVRWGAQPDLLTGVDLLSDRVDEARRLCPAGIQIHCGSAASLGFPADVFDIVLQSTVFTSIQEEALKQQVSAEMTRVTRRGGIILWYDFRVNNPQNPDVSGITKREILKLFPGCEIALYSITVAPPLVRRLAPWSWLTCYLAGKVPWLRTHYLGIIRKRER